jgi:hypothetical protein
LNNIGKSDEGRHCGRLPPQLSLTHDMTAVSEVERQTRNRNFDPQGDSIFKALRCVCLFAFHFTLDRLARMLPTQSEKFSDDGRGHKQRTRADDAPAGCCVLQRESP